MSMRQFIQQYILHYDPVDVKNDMIDSNNDSNKISSSNSDSSSGNRNSNRKNNDTVKGYLAQHRLFDQIPILRADFTAPDYCALLTARDEDFLTLTISNSDNTTYSSGSSSSGDFYGRDTLEEDVSVNMWFGPSDTQSPLHHDPFHNLLVQVHGYKYVRLYPSSESDKLYPREGRLYNNSSVDVLCPNLNIHPEFEEAVYWDIVLKPGDTLYIPRWCWHFVLALDHHCVLTDEHIRSSTTIDLTSSEDNCKCSSHKNSNNHIEDMKSLFCVSVNFWWGPRIEKQ